MGDTTDKTQTSNMEQKGSRDLKSQMKIMDILMKQNAQLEREIKRLNLQLDESTKGILMRGYLFKFREREISYASKWGLRYFTLQGTNISYYIDDRELRPRKTFSLAGCIVRDDGIKKGKFHVFSVFWPSTESADETVGNLLLRLSSERREEAVQWIHMLEQACAIDVNQSVDTVVDQELNGETISIDKATVIQQDDDTEMWTNVPIDDILIKDDNDNSSIPLETLRRVQSSSQILKKSLSRIAMVSVEPVKKVLPFPALKILNPSEKPGPGISSKPVVISAAEVLRRRFPASKPMHTEAKSSPLSSDVRPSDQNYRGFFNLGVIILILSNVRIIADNLAKYGLIAFQQQVCVTASGNATTCPVGSETSQWAAPRAGQAAASWILSILVSFILECLAASGVLSENATLICSIVVGTANIVLPCLWVYFSDTHPAACMVYLFQAVVLWMKLISYAHVNRDLRAYLRSRGMVARDGSFEGSPSSDSLDKLGGSGGLDKWGLSGAAASGSRSPMSSRGNMLNTSSWDNLDATPRSIANVSEVKDLEAPFLQYPMNITLLNLLYFCVAPTLCYQLNYPRSPSIRLRYVATILLRMAAVGGLILFAIEQYIAPVLVTSLQPMKEMNILQIFELLLKLSIPNTYIWLLGFYFYFHLWLNFLAELTRFGDRLFYKDWWNARTISTYWKTWNLPVHHWMLRHLYYPLLNAGASKVVATLIVFAFSAAFHEVVISTPFHQLALHAFFGMLAQAPLIFLTDKIDKMFDNAFVGNAIFWCLFCVVGQPMGIIMYNYDLTKS